MMKKLLIYALFAVLFVFLGWYLFQTPSNARDWSPDQEVLPFAEFHDDGTTTIRNIRNFTYRSTTDYDPEYYDKTFDPEKLVSVDYIVEPFESIGAAHTFLSFGFEGGDYVAISIEIRKEKGESFSPLKGLLRRYEIMYVIADERDVIKLRALHRKDPVYVYPVRGDREKMKTLFADMLTRANELLENPEFYNTLTNTCTTNIASHVNKISPKRVPWDFRLLFPRNSDVLAYELGLIDTNLPLEEARKKFLINDKAERYADDPDFSVKIREQI